MVCNMCPRRCNRDRSTEKGFCGSDDKIRIAKVMVHKGEEPVLIGEIGSGAIFFSGCVLKCPFCQNYPISHGNKGEIYSQDMLKETILSLQKQGVSNINLITPTHFLDYIIPVLREVKPLLNIPVVYNTGGYELSSQMERLDGLIDIYLPDLKYYSNELSMKYSGAKDYFLHASNAIKEMVRQQPTAVIEDGIMKKGVIIRHLVLPNSYKDSMELMRWVKNEFDIPPLVSVMRQYTPCYDSSKYPEINRRLTTFEYEKVTELCAELGLEGFTQLKGCDTLDMTPDF